MGQYHAVLIESKLKAFRTELFLVTAALGESAPDTGKMISLTGHLGATLNKRILVLDPNGIMLADSKNFVAQHNIIPAFQIEKEEAHTLDSVKILKNTARWVGIPFSKPGEFAAFSGHTCRQCAKLSGVPEARQGNVSLSAWHDAQGEIILTAAMPVVTAKRHCGRCHADRGG